MTPPSYPSLFEHLSGFNLAIIYALLWWFVFFLLLPIGVRTDHPDKVPGQASSAPEKPYILLKMAVTTLVTSLITLGIWTLSTL